MIRNTALALCAALCLCAGRVNGDIIPIGPFDGEYSDDFGSYPFSAHATRLISVLETQTSNDFAW